MTVLGLDIGGANLKAATSDNRAISVPFALWKQPDQLPAALTELVARFPDANELAITMTGELCDCYETKRQGVNAILDAAAFSAKGRPVRVWSTAGKFVGISEARQNHLGVAAANWHALATFAGRFAPHRGALLIDIGSTSTDVIPLRDGVPAARGLTDRDRLQSRELVYLGVRRTPVFAIVPDRVCAELFATTQDAFVILGLLPEDAADCETANGQSLTHGHCLTRLARVKGADREELSEAAIVAFAGEVHMRMVQLVAEAAKYACTDPETAIVSGAGEFLARQAIAASFPGAPIVSLNEALGPEISACAPAFALTQIWALQPGV